MNKREIDRCLTQMQQGDNAAFELLYEQTKRGVFSIVYPYCMGYDEAEDVMQTVYLRVKENILSYRAGTDGRSWLLTVARNHAANEYKKNRRTVAVSDDALAAIGGSSPPYDGGAFEALNRALGVDERKVVVLHVFWGFKHREIAKTLQMPIGTVTSKYKTAIAKMRQFLEEAEQ